MRDMGLVSSNVVTDSDKKSLKVLLREESFFQERIVVNFENRERLIFCFDLSGSALLVNPSSQKLQFQNPSLDQQSRIKGVVIATGVNN